MIILRSRGRADAKSMENLQSSTPPTANQGSGEHRDHDGDGGWGNGDHDDDEEEGEGDNRDVCEVNDEEEEEYDSLRWNSLCFALLPQ